MTKCSHCIWVKTASHRSHRSPMSQMSQIFSVCSNSGRQLGVHTSCWKNCSWQAKDKLGDESGPCGVTHIWQGPVRKADGFILVVSPIGKKHIINMIQLIEGFYCNDCLHGTRNLDAQWFHTDHQTILNMMLGLIQANDDGSKEGVNKRHTSTAIWCRRLTEMLFSILLNWPLGLIIPLAGFRCHTVWDVGVEGVAGVWRGTEQGRRLRGRWGRAHQVCDLCYDLPLSPHPEHLPHLDLLISRFDAKARQQPVSRREASQRSHRPVANEGLDKEKTKGSVRHGRKQKPICVFLRNA